MICNAVWICEKFARISILVRHARHSQSNFIKEYNSLPGQLYKSGQLHNRIFFLPGQLYNIECFYQADQKVCEAGLEVEAVSVLGEDYDANEVAWEIMITAWIMK